MSRNYKPNWKLRTKMILNTLNHFNHNCAVDNYCLSKNVFSRLCNSRLYSYVSPLSWNAELVNIAILKHSLLSDASHSVNRFRPSCCALEVAIVDLKSSMKGGSVYICNVNKLCIPAQRRHIRVQFFIGMLCEKLSGIHKIR